MLIRFPANVSLLRPGKQPFRYLDAPIRNATEETQRKSSVTKPAPVADNHSPARKIAGFAANLRYEDVPARVQAFARHHILDTLGTTLAATHFDFAHRALSGANATGETGHATVIGMAARLPLKDAALVNGILAHGLDYDDTHAEGPVHPSAAAFPCAFGLAEQLNRSGKELITAYLLGVETITRVGMAANGMMHKSGFHTTGVAGHLGCAVTAARLLNLNTDQITWAQGLAGSTASAIGEFRTEGAWSKRIHAGWAAVGGIAAASLASSGFTGPEKVYEGEDGLLRSHTGAYFPETRVDALTSELGIAWRAEEVAVKPYPICHILHACVDAALVLKRKHHLQPGDIAEVRALLHPETFARVCTRPEVRRHPATEYIAKFSVYFTIAAALVRGRCGLAELEPDALQDPAILAIADRVSYEADAESQFPQYFSGGVVIRMKDGQTYTHVEKINRGAGDRALTGDEIAAKFMENAKLVMSRSRAERIRDCVLALDRCSTHDFARLLGA